MNLDFILFAMCSVMAAEQTTQCSDTSDGATDSIGDTCADYWDYCEWRTLFDTIDFDSSAMCCACGGGVNHNEGDGVEDWMCAGETWRVWKGKLVKTWAAVPWGVCDHAWDGEAANPTTCDGTPCCVKDNGVGDVTYHQWVCNGPYCDPACTAQAQDYVCDWTKHNDSYSSGYAETVDGTAVDTQFDETNAKKACILMGTACKAITCAKDGKCTLRKSDSLTYDETTDETTYKPDTPCFCEWREETNSFSLNYIENKNGAYVDTKFTSQIEAKEKCKAERSCQAVTCKPEEGCTMRASKTLTTSNAGETSWAKTSNCNNII